MTKSTIPLLLRTIFCFVLSLALLIGGGLPTKTQQIEREKRVQAQIETEFVPVLRFVIASDVHVMDASKPRNAERFAKLFQTAYRYADAHESYKALDAVLLAGDIVNNGADEEYDEFNRVVRENLRDGTQFITVMGNHEFRVGGHEGYLRNVGGTLDKHVVINGFHFIGMSPDPDGTKHSLKQLFWLHDQLRQAKADDPEKPIFTMQHGHIWNTVYVSRSWFTHTSVFLNAIYVQYPQVIDFSGHSHGPINNPLAVWQSGYTLYGTGTLNYLEMEDDIGDNTVPEGCDEKAAQYTIVEVDANNRVRLMPFNILTNDFFKTPSTTDDPDKQLIYFVEKPSDRSTFAYTAARKKTNGKPWFDENAAVQIGNVTDTTAEVTFDQAQDNVCVYGYRITASDKTKPHKAAAEKEIYSEYYFEPMPQTLSCTLEGLLAGHDYTVQVVPLNVWTQAGGAITTEFRTRG